MSDIFDRIEQSVRAGFDGKTVCVHVGDPDECDFKRHPTYQKFRREAVVSGIRSAPSSRLWEPLNAMGRVCDLRGGTKWRMVVIDCLTPVFRSFSKKNSWTGPSWGFRTERDEIRSAMVATALEVWAATTVGVPPRHVRDRMVKAAFDVAARLARRGTSDFPVDDLDLLLFSGEPVESSGLLASSIIDCSGVRDADMAERIRGERLGHCFRKWVTWTECGNSTMTFGRGGSQDRSVLLCDSSCSAPGPSAGISITTPPTSSLNSSAFGRLRR
ncbi:hypothetical protein [Kitasatospora cineracea]|uniref:hypothetical protein n=1 Tax=Kitasatospora cineracea TaxID=88074 RepID=UPI00379461D5